MKYKVGDIIKIRNDLKENQVIEGEKVLYCVSKEMLEDTLNKPLEVIKCYENTCKYIVKNPEGKEGKVCDEVIEGLWTKKEG